ncbi:MAG: helix-turn-helix domain-containing protein [Tepidanaerobacteraceae bacterium]
MFDGKTIRSYRHKRNLSLEELARKSGLSVSYLSEIERCKKRPSLETIDKIAEALSISKQGLFTTIGNSIAAPVAPGNKISLLRQKNNLSLSELADRAGISATYLCQIENNKVMPSLAALKDIAKGLGVKTEELMTSIGNVGYKLKKIRTERKMSQAELAKKAGVSTGLIGQIENGKVEPSIKTLEKIASAVAISPCYFVAEDDEITSLFKVMNPKLRKLFLDPKVRSILELLTDCSTEEFSFILKFIQLYKESHGIK